MSSSGLLNLKGLGRDSGKTRALKCWQLGKVKVQGTCVDFLDRVWAQEESCDMEERLIGGSEAGR